MALDTPPLAWEQTDFAFKAETTTGTPVALAAADGTTNVFNADVKYNTEKVERQGQGSLSPIRQGTGMRVGQATFATELYGGATAAATIGLLFKACGMLATGSVYTPKTRPNFWLTMGKYISGRLKRLSGCQGTGVLTFSRAKAPRAAWTFSGVQQPLTDVTQILPTYDPTVAPEIVTTFTIGGDPFILPEVAFDLGNNVIYREDLKAVDEDGKKTGCRSAQILGRRPTFKCSPEALPLSTKDWSDVFQSRTPLAISIVCDDGDGNTITIAAPKLELDQDPEDVNRTGIFAEDLMFLARRSADAGDDEYSITTAAAE